MTHRILFTNLGYARGIDGSLRSHLVGARHHFNCPPEVQRKALAALKTLMHQHQVDVVCAAEIDAGSSNNRNFDQLHYLKDSVYAHGAALNKYGARVVEGKVTVSSGKSNGFLAKTQLEHRFRYLTHGTKRLICQIQLAPDLSIWFGHFSLRPWIRQKQFAELASWLEGEKGEVILLGDFNNYRGTGELLPLTRDAGLRLMNLGDPTFRFARYQAAIDLCLATAGVAERCHVHVVPQNFSDHDALLVEIR